MSHRLLKTAILTIACLAAALSLSAAGPDETAAAATTRRHQVSAAHAGKTHKKHRKHHVRHAQTAVR